MLTCKYKSNKNKKTDLSMPIRINTLLFRILLILAISPGLKSGELVFRQGASIEVHDGKRQETVLTPDKECLLLPVISKLTVELHDWKIEVAR